MNRKPISLIFPFVILISMLLSACGAPAQAVHGSFAGRVENSNALIGLVTNGEQLLAYFCDGTQDTAPELWGWFRGDVHGNVFELTNDGGDRLTGEFEAEGASGTIHLLDGTVLKFQAALVEEPAGLYRLEETLDGTKTVTGWIVLANGDWRGGKKSAGQLTTASRNPISWVDPDPDPWVDPDIDPWVDPDPQP